MDDEEKRILLKLEKGGLIELHLPDGETDEEESMLSTFTPSEFMMGHDFIYIKILPAFYSKYYLYNLTSFGGNMWNAVNPFWVTWQMLRCAGLLVEWLWAKSKIATAVIGTLSAVLVFDWSLAWKNLSLIIKFVKSIM